MIDLTVKDLVQGLASVDASLRHWALVIRPQERGVPTKTGEFDKSLVWDSDAFGWISKTLQRLKTLRGNTDLLWPLSMEEYGKMFHKALSPS